MAARTSKRRTGGDLLSQGVAPQVPSALKGLTALFGMGRGVSLSLCTTGDLRDARWSLKTAQAKYGQGNKYPSSPRTISTGRLRPLLDFHRRPINLVVYQGSYSLKGMGEFISRTASRLDAFSGYPFRAYLSCGPLGRTTATPEAPSARSSRTRDDSSQLSNAHSR